MHYSLDRNFFFGFIRSLIQKWKYFWSHLLLMLLSHHTPVPPPFPWKNVLHCCLDRHLFCDFIHEPSSGIILALFYFSFIWWILIYSWIYFPENLGLHTRVLLTVYASYSFLMHIVDVRIKRVKQLSASQLSFYGALLESWCYFTFHSTLGCTPLHWAAIRGQLEACTVLVQAGKKEDLIVIDNTGLTPAQLASDKNHRQVAFFLVGVSCP